MDKLQALVAALVGAAPAFIEIITKIVALALSSDDPVRTAERTLKVMVAREARAAVQRKILDG